MPLAIFCKCLPVTQCMRQGCWWHVVLYKTAEHTPLTDKTNLLSGQPPSSQTWNENSPQKMEKLVTLLLLTRIPFLFCEQYRLLSSLSKIDPRLSLPFQKFDSYSTSPWIQCEHNIWASGGGSSNHNDNWRCGQYVQFSFSPNFYWPEVSSDKFCTHL